MYFKARLAWPQFQNISSWDKLSYEQKGDSYMRTVQKDWLNQKKKVSISIQFNEVRDEYNIKFVFGHFHGKPKSFGDSPIGRWVTGRTDAMALTSRRRSFCKQSMQKYVKTWPSENPLQPCAAKQTNDTRFWWTFTQAGTKWFPQKCEIQSAPWRHSAFLARASSHLRGSRRGKGGRGSAGVPQGASTHRPHNKSTARVGKVTLQM